jgi:hypothetical protein
MKATFVAPIKRVAPALMLSLAVGSLVFAEVFLAIRDSQPSIVRKGATVAGMVSESAKGGLTPIVVDPPQFSLAAQPQCAAPAVSPSGGIQPRDGIATSQILVSPPGDARRHIGEK